MRSARRVIGTALLLLSLAGASLGQGNDLDEERDRRISEIWRGMLTSAPLPDREPGGAPEPDVLLRGLWAGDRVLDTEIAIWDLNPRQLSRYLHCISTFGINALRIEPPEDLDREQIIGALDAFANFGVRALMATPFEHPAAVAAESISAEPRSGEIWGPQPLTRLTLCEASLSGVRGVLLESPPWPGGDLSLLTPFALWADAVPWEELNPSARPLNPSPEGTTVRIRGQGIHLLLWIEIEEAVNGNATLQLPESVSAPRLVDVFSMETMRRRRFAIGGGGAEVHLSAREMEGDCLILVTELPPDWATPAPN